MIIFSFTLARAHTDRTDSSRWWFYSSRITYIFVSLVIVAILNKIPLSYKLESQFYHNLLQCVVILLFYSRLFLFANARRSSFNERTYERNNCLFLWQNTRKMFDQ